MFHDNIVLAKKAADDIAKAETLQQGSATERRDVERQLQYRALQRGKTLAAEREAARDLAERAQREAARAADNLAAYEQVTTMRRDLLAKVVSTERCHQVMVERASAAQQAAELERTAKRGLREAARGPAVRAADAAAKPILPRRE